MLSWYNRFSSILKISVFENGRVIRRRDVRFELSYIQCMRLHQVRQASDTIVNNHSQLHYDPHADMPKPVFIYSLLLIIFIGYWLYMRCDWSTGRQVLKCTSLEALAPRLSRLRKTMAYFSGCHGFCIFVGYFICRLAQHLFSLCCPSELVGIVRVYHLSVLPWEYSTQNILDDVCPRSALSLVM